MAGASAARADPLALGVRIGYESVPAPATTALMLAGLGLLATRCARQSRSTRVNQEGSGEDQGT
ncbi:MAG: PEP-CTERM sorting domain-containing protein [Haliea sp.]|nr:PEP-CTERM sorting domain-containing protein [Haliea sp.]